jgi:hypothetical protein
MYVWMYGGRFGRFAGYRNISNVSVPLAYLTHDILVAMAMVVVVVAMVVAVVARHHGGGDRTKCIYTGRL